MVALISSFFASVGYVYPEQWISFGMVFDDKVDTDKHADTQTIVSLTCPEEEVWIGGPSPRRSKSCVYAQFNT